MSHGVMKASMFTVPLNSGSIIFDNGLLTLSAEALVGSINLNIVPWLRLGTAQYFNYWTDIVLYPLLNLSTMNGI